MKTIDHLRNLAGAFARMSAPTASPHMDFGHAAPCCSRFSVPMIAKKALLALFPALLCLNAPAQTTMKVTWSTKLDHIMTSMGFSDDGNYCYGSNATEFSIVDSANGTILWNKAFKDIDTRFSKIDEQMPVWDDNVLLVFVRNQQNDLIGGIDLTTGNLLWSSQNYQNLYAENIIQIPGMEALLFISQDGVTMVKTRTGEEIWSTTGFKGERGAHVYMPDGSLVLFLYNSTASAPWDSGIGNRIVKINVNNGNVEWISICQGEVEFKLVTGEPLLNLQVQGGKVLLYLDGIQAYDYTTGASSWSAAWESVLNKQLKVLDPPKNAKQFAWYGAVAEPLISGNDVYVIDTQGKNKQSIKKYDLESGNLLWTSPDFENATAIPAMYLVGDTILLQMGGKVECQYHEVIYSTYNGYGGYSSNSNDPSVDRWLVREFNISPYGLIAFHSGNGSLAWQSDVFTNGITNFILCGNQVIVSDNAALYSFDLTTGIKTYTVKLKGDGIGLAQFILDYKDVVLVVGEKGVSRHRPNDGGLVKSTKWKATSLTGMYAETLVFQKGNTIVTTYNEETGGYYTYKPKTGCVTRLSADGKSLYAWEKDTITRVVAR